MTTTTPSGVPEGIPIVDLFPNEEVRRTLDEAERLLEHLPAGHLDYTVIVALAQARATIAQVHATQRQTRELIELGELLAGEIQESRQAIEGVAATLSVILHRHRPLWRVAADALGSLPDRLPWPR